jgi:RNase P subunit RPR2
VRVILNKYQKTLGFAICAVCHSVLCVQKTDVRWERNEQGKTVSVFYCGACDHKQEFKRKDLTSRKAALLAESGK